MKVKLFSLVLIILIILGLFYFNIFDPYYFRRLEAKKLIFKIEEYYDKNNKYPDSLADLGIVPAESGPIYYEKKSGTQYIVWFGTALGESETYDSTKKQWE